MKKLVLFIVWGLVFVGLQVRLFANDLVFIEDKEKFVVSNYPEEVIEPSIIFNEIVQKDSGLRLVYYHKNKSLNDLYINILVKNEDAATASVKFIGSEGGPSKDGLFVGHQVTKRFFSAIAGNSSNSFELLPGESRKVIWQLMKPEQVVAGIVRLRSGDSSGLRVKMQIVDPKCPQLSALNKPKGKKVYYGCFDSAHKEIDVKFDCKALLGEVPIGDKPFLEDERSGLVLRGNYGVIYKINLELNNKFSGFRKVDMLFSPIAGMARLLMMVDGQLVESGLLGDNNTEPEKVMEFVLNPREKRHVQIITMPQPGSFYPACIVLRSNVTEYAILLEK
jgi:hypothetical protein